MVSPSPDELPVVPPPVGSRWPLVGAVAAIAVLCVGAAVVVLSGGGDDATVGSAGAGSTTGASVPVGPITDPASTETVVTSPASPTTVEPAAESTIEPAVVETTVVVASSVPAEVPVAATGCEGSTDTGTVPTLFLDALTGQVSVTSCRFAGRWALAFWEVGPGLEEAALFNIDQPLEQGMPLPSLRSTPSGCIVDRVGDPVIGESLAVGFPIGACA